MKITKSSPKICSTQCVFIIIITMFLPGMIMTTIHSFYDVYNQNIVQNNNHLHNIPDHYNISNQLFKALISYYIPHYIFIDLNTTYNYSCTLTFCCTVGGLGIGNVLSQYWLARSLSYFMQCDFQMFSGLNKSDLCNSLRFGSSGRHRTGLQKKMFNPKHFAYYLPKIWTPNITNYKLYRSHFDINANMEFILYMLYHAGPFKSNEHGYFPYTTNERLLYYNTQFIQNIALYDTQNAFKSYHKFLKYERKSINAPDIVIHYRCGDLLSRRNAALYGLLSMSFYNKSFEIISKYYKGNTIKNIWILTQFGTKALLTESMWGRNKRAVDQAQDFSKILVDEFFVPALYDLVNSFYNGVNITVFGNNDVGDDVYSFVNAPVLICSLSSFCTTTALGNENLVIMPQGALYNQTEIINVEIPSNHKLINIDMENGMLLTTVEIVDNKMSIFSVGRYIVDH
eukprot:220611_1